MKKENIAQENIYIVRQSAEFYSNDLSIIDEMESEGYVTFAEALSAWDESLNISFKTFAKICLENKFRNILKNKKNKENNKTIKTSNIDMFVSDYADVRNIENFINNERNVRLKLWIREIVYNEFIKQNSLGQHIISNRLFSDEDIPETLRSIAKRYKIRFQSVWDKEQSIKKRIKKEVLKNENYKRDQSDMW